MKVKLVDVREESSDTKSFFWETDIEIKFKAGQYFYYSIPQLKDDDPRGKTRHFTISSSPTEKLLRLTTKIAKDSSSYKKALGALSIGSIIEGQGPEGTFILKDNDRTPHVFIAGGIGITPFRSMTKYVLDKKLDIPILLIYSASNNDFIFKKEMDLWQNKNIEIIYYDSGKNGRLNGYKIRAIVESSIVKDLKSAKWWIVGPPPFVDSIEKQTESLGISDSKIFTEKFTGY